MKRVIALLLILTMLAGMLPVLAQAEEITVDGDQLTVEGTNGFGKLLSEELEREQAAMETQQTVGYTLTDLEITGNEATVTYASREKAVVVVALYTEDGMQLLTSGKADVLPEETQVTLTLQGEMPRYFRASAYLLDPYDLSPLCKAYETPMYTRQMQQLLSSTAEDYPEDRVLQLDSGKETNFAVYAADTRIITPAAGVNTVVSADDETNTYVLENIDQQIMSLRPGDVFSYSCGNNQVLIVKVASITLEGTTAVIVGDALDMDQVFSHVKIQAVGDNEDMTVDDSTAYPGITYVGMTQSSPEARSATQSAGSTTYSHEFDLGVKATADSEFMEAGVTITGTVKVTLETTFEYYLGEDMQYVRFYFEPEVQVTSSISGSVKGKLPLGDFGFSPVPGVFIGFSPKLILEFTGKASIATVFSCTLGFAYDEDAEFQNLSTWPNIDAVPTLEGAIAFGIDWCPNISVVLEKEIIRAELSISTVLELSGKLTGTDYEAPGNAPKTRHDCKKCLQLEMNFKVSLGGELSLFDLDWLTLPITLGTLSFPIGQGHYSYDHDLFGFGNCPYLSYRISVYVTNANTTPAEALEVVAVNDFGETVSVLGTTNRNGALTAYLGVGTYLFHTTNGTDSAYKTQTVTEPCYLSLRLQPGLSPDQIPDEPQEDSMDLSGEQGFEDVVDAVSGGTCGTNAAWELDSNGILYIRGSGAMQNYYYNSPAPWKSSDTAVTGVWIAPGITSIGASAFEDCTDLSSVFIPDTVTTIGSYAFSDCVSLTSVEIPDSVTKTGNYVFSGCEDLTQIVLSENMTTISKGMLSRCISLKTVTLPKKVTVIDSVAFSGCTGLTAVTLPRGLTTIGSEAFKGCGSIAGIHIPEGVTAIDRFAFDSCTRLASVTVPGSVSVIEVSAFSNCTALASVTICSGVTTVKGSAFSGCTNLWDVNLPGSVTTIGTSAFSGCTSLEKVILPGKITKIEDYLFENCTSLVDVNIPDGVTAIGNRAFNGCTLLPGLDIPAGVTSIGSSAFAYCAGLTNLPLPETVTAIGDSAFSNAGLTTFTVPQKVTVIENRTFSGCTQLSAVYFPYGLTKICEYAFQNCSSLDNIIIPGSVESILSYAFSGCSKLSRVELPDGITSLSYGVFSDCTGLEQIKLPGGITYFGAEMFKNCTSLSKVEIPQGVTGIGQNAFEDCTGLETVDIPDSVTSIGRSAFEGCCKLDGLELPEGLTSIGTYAFSGCTRLSELTIPDAVGTVSANAFKGCTALAAVDLGNGVTTVEDEAFASCTGLLSVILPESLTSLGSNVFKGCTGLVGIVVESGNTKYSSDSSGVLMDKKGTTVLWVPGGLQGSCTVAEGVRTIGEYAFSDCAGLTDVILPEGLDTIEQYAFWGCPKLTSITIADSVTTIGSCAFYDCPQLTEATIGSCVGTVGDYVFWGCSRLERVDIRWGVTTLGTGMFANCESLTSIFIPASVQVIGRDAFSGCDKLDGIWVDENSSYYSSDAQGVLFDHYKTTLIRMPAGKSGAYTIPDTVTTVGEGAFSGCHGLTHVTIPESVTTIDYDAFSDCTGLTDITIPGSVSNLGSYIFRGCTSLRTATVSWGITTFGYGLFSGCGKLSKVDIPASVTDLGYFAFEGCASLTSVVIPSGVTDLWMGVFNGCTSLSSVIIPEGVATIDYGAFMESGLTNVFIPDSVTFIASSAFEDCAALTDVYYSGTREQWDIISCDGDQQVLPDVNLHFNSTPGSTLTGTVSGEMSSACGIFSGEYGSQATQLGAVRTASFTGLAPGKEYVLLAMVSLEAAELLSEDNLLYIGQAAADENGKLTFRYLQRVAAEHSYVMACGPSGRDLADAQITFPDMRADGELHAVDPQVVYGGKLLTEGVDYVLTGEVVFTDAGTYTCHLRGIRDYAGDITCSYTVKGDTTTLSGAVTTYSDGDTLLELLFDDTVADTCTVSGTTGSYCFEDVSAGAYLLRVSKKNHVSREYSLTVSETEAVQDVKLCLIGDATGDGRVNVADVSRVYTHARRVSQITEEYQFACANVTGGALNVADVSRLYSHTRKIDSLHE